MPNIEISPPTRPPPSRRSSSASRARGSRAPPRCLRTLQFPGAATPAARLPPHARPRARAAPPPALLLRLRSAHPNPCSSDSWPWGASRHQIRLPRTQIQWHGRTARQLGAPAPTMGTAAMGVRHGERATSKQPVHSRARCKGRPSSLAGSDAAMLPFQASDHKQSCWDRLVRIEGTHQPASGQRRPWLALGIPTQFKLASSRLQSVRQNAHEEVNMKIVVVSSARSALTTSTTGLPACFLFPLGGQKIDPVWSGLIWARSNSTGTGLAA
ncbi:hypothetical protein PVAP13_4KG155200 [Panicum virgatum]|uniref:Uncharacterized protein n=1 Tax=Panicum virgatum TaxID=38727 RepID=A0A8T0TJC2_PANVG|nr:hypothetical protein PVAP13_4KG155200 [Panicum virgatum]